MTLLAIAEDSQILVEEQPLQVWGGQPACAPSPRPLWDAFAGFHIMATGAAGPPAIVSPGLVVPLLGQIQDGALELRALATDHIVRYYMIARCTCGDVATARAEGHAVAQAIAELVRLMQPGLELRALHFAETRAVLRPFRQPTGGDLRDDRSSCDSPASRRVLCRHSSRRHRLSRTT